jgi:4-hydroxy-3-polyprenylbenzoate decarboxylase
MGYRTLRQCVEDLAATGQLAAIEEPIDPELEAAEIQRRVYRVGGPAIYFARVKGCQFPMVGNLFGTMDRVRYIFRDSLAGLKRLVSLGADPADVFRHPRLYLRSSWFALSMWPKKVRSGPILAHETTLDQLPQFKSWPRDGGAYITLPQVYTEDPGEPGFARSNLGMYRVQISGGEYERNREAGLHYQLQRGIAAHHAKAIERKEIFRVNVFVGGPPAMTVAAVMPLPEGMSELGFAGLLGRRRVAMICRPNKLPIAAEADFCITGYLDPKRLKPEGPFGDHLGYYSLAHEFPVLHVEHVHHRQGAIWPFTVVGRPPQEDTIFGRLIHELAGETIAKTIPGIKAVHAVDAAGVHPLLLAIGSERYIPYDERRRPRELLTLANGLLGQGQLSLAKYLLIVAGEDQPDLDVRHVPDFFRHLLERVDWRRDLHFQTCTTIDTLDYSSGRLNEGSKVVIAAAGPAKRILPVAVDSMLALPEDLGFKKARIFLPGILLVEGPAYRAEADGRDSAIERFCARYTRHDVINAFPWVVIVDQSEFTAAHLENFLWVTFTRSNPATDIYGIESFVVDKHWGARGSLVIDARSKPHHAPPLAEDPAVSVRIDAMAARGGPLHGII